MVKLPMNVFSEVRTLPTQKSEKKQPSQLMLGVGSTLMVVIFLIGLIMNNNYEYDGLVYKPLIQSVIPQKNESEDTIYDFLDQKTQESNFPVEPVREWIQPDNFD